MMVHPFPGPTDDALAPIIAVRQLDITYRGREAHASAYPTWASTRPTPWSWPRRPSACCASSCCPTDRVHGIVTKGGDAANIIPARRTPSSWCGHPRESAWTRSWRWCRAASRPVRWPPARELELVEQIAYDDMRHDLELAAIYRRNAESIGRVFEETWHALLDRHGQRLQRGALDPPEHRHRDTRRGQSPGGVRGCLCHAIGRPGHLRWGPRDGADRHRRGQRRRRCASDCWASRSTKRRCGREAYSARSTRMCWCTMLGTNARG